MSTSNYTINMALKHFRRFYVILCHTQGIYGSVLQKKSEAYKEIESPGKLFFFSNLGIGCVLVL